MSGRKIILSEKQMQQITEGGYLNNCETDYHNAYGNETFTDSPLSDVASGIEYSKPTITNKVAHSLSTNFTRNNYAGITSMPIHEEETIEEEYNRALLKKKIKAGSWDKELDDSTRNDSTASKLKHGGYVSFDAIKDKVKRIKNGESVGDSEESNDAIKREYERQKALNKAAQKLKNPLKRVHDRTKLNPIIFNFKEKGGIKGKNDVGIITLK